MEVIYWQLFVIGSTVAAYIFKSRRFSVWVAIGWSLWTFVMLSYSPLVILQLCSAWGAFLLIDRFMRQRSQINEFESTLAGFQNNDKAAFESAMDELHKEDKILLIQARKDGHCLLLTDSSHYDYMLKEIDRSEATVVILSGWISESVINKRFLDAVKKAIDRGVKVYFGFGYEYNGQHEMKGGAQRALANLIELRDKYRQGLHIGKFNNHRKVLVIDQRRAVIGSHNWLSNQAFKNHEQSYIINDQSIAEVLFSESSNLINNNLM